MWWFFLPETKSWSSTCWFGDIIDLMEWITSEQALETSLLSLLSHTEGVSAIQKLFFFFKMKDIVYVKGNSTIHRTKTASSERHITHWISLEIMFLWFSRETFSLNRWWFLILARQSVLYLAIMLPFFTLVKISSIRRILVF